MLSISLCNKLLFAAALIPTTNFAATEKHTFEPDSAILRQLDEVVVTSDPKITGSLMSQPFSYTTINTAQLNNLGVHSLKDAAAFVPNLFMPDYGSRLTSAIYIRGVGSRLNTPAVGMYVDDVAVKEKSAFDTDFSDVERIDVLRGPQSTLFGRNAMGGLIRLYTFNPITVLETGSQTRIRLGASTKDAGRYVNFRTAHALASDVAMSLSGFYEGNDGFNKNTYLDRRSNGGNSGGGKLRIVYNPEGNKAFTLDFQTSLERSVENGYDYYKVDDFRDTPSLDHIGESREGELGEYRRTLWNTSLKLNYVAKHFTVTDVVGFQLLRDHMYMDQDFSPSRVFTLAQNQRSRYLSNELVFKSNENKRLQWVGGVYTARQWLKTNAPVLFQEAGIEQYIQNGINSGFAKANAAMNPMGMNIGLTIDDDNMLVSGLFNTPSTNLAAFGQATLRDLLPNLDLTAGLRIDYEHNYIDYLSSTSLNYTFKVERTGMPMPMINQQFTTTTSYIGTINNDYTQALPKVALTWRLPNSNIIYGSVSKGFRSGGYNIQMFSELIQASLRNDMTATMLADPTLGPMMSRTGMSAGTNPSADSTTVYKPETSWNYELGTRLNFLDNHLTVNASVYYIHTYNQQVTRFAANGFGRQMVNAGKSTSYGFDLSANAWMPLGKNTLLLNAAYGFTHAKFDDYVGEEDYSGNYVPFAPRYTLSAAAELEVPVKNVVLNMGANIKGAGRTYWTEDNSASEPFYLLLGAHVGATYKQFTLNFWGKNLTDCSYVPFYFVSMQQGFAQPCRPIQFGVDLTINL